MSSSQALDWRKLFDLSSEQNLEFSPPEVHGGSVIVKPPPEVFDEGIRRWKHLLVAQFLRRPPKFGSLQKLVDMLWSKQGAVEVKMRFLLKRDLAKLQVRLVLPFTWIIQRLTYAKVCVEISIDFEFLRFINVELRDGSFISIGVEVP
ncbi:Glucosyltransferase-I [Gossypium australe]|uniref:Glucosyltransferase-I n=1 Tax=Gossypium australe TaxID=47621 RepID=A0A5B6X1V3_9ROSI|nr:Glucosyltransferase-I [Gossypium australe]